MKYLIALILLIISTFSFGQKNNYEVFNLTNQVSIKHRGSIDWIIAKKGMTLGFLDSVRVCDNSDIRILDMRSNEVYHFNKCGYFRVKDIRDAVRAQSASILSAMYAQISKQNDNRPAMNMVGATTRGQGNEELIAVAKSIVRIAKNIQQGKHTFDTGLDLLSHCMDGEVCFSIQNNTSNHYCVNVVMCDFQNQKASLCYVISPTISDYPYVSLSPNQSIDLMSWHFTQATSSRQYFLIATKQFYDTEQLQHILTRLDWDTIDVEDSTSISIFSFK